MRVLRVAVLASVVAFAAWFAWPRATFDTVAVPQAVAPAAADSRSPAVAIRETVQPPRPRPAAEDFRTRFVTTTDLHAFARDALARPAAGGAIYGLLAFTLCDKFRRATEGRQADVREEIESTSTLRANRRATIDRWETRCAAFTEAELGAKDESVVRFESSRTRSRP
jgi:hypothetical protein